MAELKRTGYAKRLWDAWKEFEKEHGDLSGVKLSEQVQARVGRKFDDSMLSKIHRGKRLAKVDEHYALAFELKIEPDKLAGPWAHAVSVPELETIEEVTLPVVEVRAPKKPRKRHQVRGVRPR